MALSFCETLMIERGGINSFSFPFFHKWVRPSNQHQPIFMNFIPYDIYKLIRTAKKIELWVPEIHWRQLKGRIIGEMREE